MLQFKKYVYNRKKQSKHRVHEIKISSCFEKWTTNRETMKIVV